jgi:hypothetical protein
MNMKKAVERIARQIITIRFTRTSSGYSLILELFRVDSIVKANHRTLVVTTIIGGCPMLISQSNSKTR